MKRMRMLTWDGPVMARVVTDTAASTISAHWHAVRHYIDTGDEGRLGSFSGELINLHRFLTDLDRVDELADLGELEFENIYEDIS